MNARSSVLTVTVAAVALLIGSTAAAADDLRLEIGERSWPVDRVEPRPEAIRERPGTLAVWLTVGFFEGRQAPPQGKVSGVSLVRGTAGQEEKYLEIELTDVIVSSYQTSGPAARSDSGPHLRLRYRSAKRIGPDDVKAPGGRAARQGTAGPKHPDEIELQSWSWGEGPDELGRVKVEFHWDRGQSAPGPVTFEGHECLVFFLGAIPGEVARGRMLPRLEGRTKDAGTFVLERARVTRLGPCRGGERKLEAWGWAYEILPQIEQ